MASTIDRVIFTNRIIDIELNLRNPDLLSARRSNRSLVLEAFTAPPAVTSLKLPHHHGSLHPYIIHIIYAYYLSTSMTPIYHKGHTPKVS